MSEIEVGQFGGSCICGEVTYGFDLPPKVTVACHCSSCRKATGSAFGTWTLVPKESFRWLKGAEHVAEFASSDHARRLFCRLCGTTLGNLTNRRPNFMHLAAGTLDRAPPLRIAMHVYATSKAGWYDITDDLPQHDTEPTKRS